MAKTKVKPGRGPREGPGRMSHPARASRRYVYATCVGAVLLVVGGLALVFLRQGDRQAGESPIPAVDTEPESEVMLPVHEPLRSEEDVMRLRHEETVLAAQLMRDFPDEEEALVIAANMYHRRGQVVEAQELRKRVLQINPRRADVYVGMAWSSLRIGDFENAIAEYRSALEIEPNIPEANLNIGRALMMLGRQEEAIAPFVAETKVSPDSGFAHFLLGQVHLQLQEYAKAKENYERAIEIQPDSVNAYYGLTLVCARLGQREQAQAYAEQFQKLKAQERERLKQSKIEYDDLAVTQKYAATTFIRAGQMYRAHGRWAEAEERFKQAVGLDPENVVSYMELASLYQRSNQPAKALAMFKKVSSVQPESPIGFLMTGVLSAQLRRLDEAETAFLQAIRLAPQASDAYRELARLYLRKGEKFSEAKQSAARALALERSAANYFVWGWACDKTGDAANALSGIKRALELDPGNVQYQRYYQMMQQRN